MIFGSDSPFGDIFSEFFGTGPIPPPSVAQKVLGIDPSLPVSKEGIKAVFRFQVKLLHPHLTDSQADALHLDAIGQAKTAERLAELLWARDDLLRRVQEPVTDATRTQGDSFSRYEEKPCKGCAGKRRTSRGEPFRKLYGRNRWAGYCWKCAEDAENARKRESRRLARADRICANCRAAFTPARSDGRYCSGRCRQQAYRGRNGKP